MAKTKTPAAPVKDAEPIILADEAAQEQAVAAEPEVTQPPVEEVTEAPAPADPAPETPAPVIPPAPTPPPAPSTDIIPEHFEQTFDLDEYARFRRLNAAQVGLLNYVAKSYPRTIREWDALKKANLGG